MPSPAETCADLMVTAAIGAVTGAPDWLIRVGQKTEDQDQEIVTYDSGGLPASPKWLLDQPTVQILVRGKRGEYAQAYSKMKEAKDVLLGLSSADIAGDRWVGVWTLSDITFIGSDEKERPSFTLNLRLIIEPATSALTNRFPL